MSLYRLNHEQERREDQGTACGTVYAYSTRSASESIRMAGCKRIGAISTAPILVLGETCRFIQFGPVPHPSTRTWRSVELADMVASPCFCPLVWQNWADENAADLPPLHPSIVDTLSNYKTRPSLRRTSGRCGVSSVLDVLSPAVLCCAERPKSPCRCGCWRTSNGRSTRLA